jgi:hypothetical protein
MQSFALDAQPFAWNIPSHMLSGAIAYQTLQRESPATIPIGRSILEKNPSFLACCYQLTALDVVLA